LKRIISLKRLKVLYYMSENIIERLYKVNTIRMDSGYFVGAML